jgi:hypothetical protein
MLPMSMMARLTGVRSLRGGNCGSFQEHRKLALVSEKIGNYLK